MSKSKFHLLLENSIKLLGVGLLDQSEDFILRFMNTYCGSEDRDHLSMQKNTFIVQCSF